MIRILTTIAVNAVALGVATWIFDGIRVGNPRTDTTEDVVTLVLVAVVFGVVNAIVTPLVKLVSLPLIVLTLGLFLLVVNALMLLLTEAIADAVGLEFQVQGFWTAVGGALVISLIGIAADAALDRD